MAGAHRPRPPPTPTAPESGDAISEPYRKCRFSVYCPECRGGPSWSRTLRVAFSGRGAWIACRWGFGTCGNLKATAALTTLRITSTVSHPHRALCWFPATWPTAGGPPQFPCHPPALAPPRRTTQPALARSSPPAPQQHPGPLLFCRCIPSDCAPGQWAPGCPFPDGGRTYLNHRHLCPRPPYLVAFFLLSASSPFAHHPRVPSIRLSYHLAAINLRNRRSIVRRTRAQRPIRIRC